MLYDLIWHLSTFSILIPVAVSLIAWKFIRSKPLKLITYYLFTYLFIEILLYLLADQKINNLPVIHLFTITEFIFLSLVYHRAFSYPFGKAVAKWTVPVFVLFAICSAVYLQGIYTYNSYVRGAEAFIISFYALLYLYEVFMEAKIERLESYPFFWVNAGLLLYFAGNLFFFLLSNLLLSESEKMLKESWIIHFILNIEITLFFKI
mgnify:CR=1 FL=1